MSLLKRAIAPLPVVTALLRWTLLIIPVSLVTGSLVALFLWLLDLATHYRWDHPWLLFLLPASGVGIYLLYRFLGKNSESGNNLIMDEIHEPGGGVPARMAPIVLISTVITHLFGGSAGREGTAVQIGGSIAQFFARRLHLKKEDISLLLTTGIAAGFGAVFGTPVTGAVFALEVLAIGRIQYDALIPCLIASVLADITCGAWGIHHTQYAIHLATAGHTLLPSIHLDVMLLLETIGAGIVFGLTSMLFATLTHTIKAKSHQWIRQPWLIPVIGGILIIALTYVLQTRDYLGLGVTAKDPTGISILSCFRAGGASPLSWWWKLLFTAITLASKEAR
jgi:H+/Cl- antiporter ClcA